MAVDSIKELRGRSGDIQGIQSTAVRRWRVHTTANTDDQYTIYANTSGIIPRGFEPHPNNLILTCRSVTITEDDDKKNWWIAEAKYSAAPVGESERQEEEIENPLARPAKIRWTTAAYQRAIYKDRDGNGIMNSAGDYFDPVVEIDESRWVATVSKNVSSVPSWLIDYTDAVNSDSFSIGGLTVEVEKAKLSQIDISELQNENGVDFYVLTYAIEFKKDGWKVVLLDQGLRKKVSGVQKDITVADDDGNESKISSPVPLNGSGGVLSDPTPANAKYKEFNVYTAKTFTVLPLT